MCLYLFGSVVPSFKEIEDALVGMIDHMVAQGSGIVGIDENKSEAAKQILAHISSDDEIVKITKHLIKEVINQIVLPFDSTLWMYNSMFLVVSFFFFASLSL